MKRLILISTLTLLLVILIGSSAFATLARIRALGNADFFFKDIYFIYTNPAYLGLYTNTVYSELGRYQEWGGGWGTPEDQFLGINYKLYKGFSLGLTLNRKAFWDPTVFEEFEDMSPPINEYDLMASYDFEKLHLGVSFYHAGNKWEREESNAISSSWEQTSGTTTLSGGFLFDLNETNSVEGMLALNFDRAKNTYQSDGFSSEDETDGGNGIMFGARGFFEVLTDFQAVPLFAFGTESISLNHRETTAGESYSLGDLKWKFFLLALGGNLKLDKGMVAGGLNLTQFNVKDERYQTNYTEEFTSWFMPGFNLGVEYELTKWLVARMGMEKEFGRGEYKFDQVAPVFHMEDRFRFTTPDEDFIGLGVGFKFSKFKVDATVGENSFFEGTYLLSGRERNLFGVLSAIFEF